MKSLEGYTIEQVKEMSHEELKVLWDKVADEGKAEAVRLELIKILEIRGADSSVIEN